MSIPEDLIAEIRDRADIVSIIGQYVQLRQRGKNYVGLCPFHPEKTPSFNVSPELGIYKCFGCGRSGDVFSFLRDHVGMSFIEAVRHVATQVGIPLPSEPDSTSAVTERRRLLHQVLDAARDFYRSQLAHHKAAQQFIDDRRLSSGMVERFQLGAAPAQWNALSELLQQRGYSVELLRDAGLVTVRDDGSFYDRFRNRVMFPIWNTSGQVIGFAGRTLSTDSDEPKYINSPQTQLYDKSSTLYALHLARQAITRQRYAIVVEGYMDAIALHSAGIEHCIATSGTALTPQHVEILRRYTEQVVFVFDGDTAGWNAAYRAVGLAISGGIAAEVVLLPEGEDPDSIVRSRGGDIARQLLAKRLSPVEFMVGWSKQTHDWSNLHVAQKQIRAIAEIIAAAPDPLYRELLMRELSDRVGISTDLLLPRTVPTRGTVRSRRAPGHDIVAEEPSAPAMPMQLLPEEATLLQVVLLSRPLARLLFEDYLFDPATLPTPTAQQLLEALGQLLAHDTSDRPPGSMLPELKLSDEVRTLAEWLVFTFERPSQRWSNHGIELDEEQHLRHVLDDALSKLELRQLGQRIDELKQQLAQQPENLELVQQIERLHKIRVQLLSRMS